jgi:hypothetical protein
MVLHEEFFLSRAIGVVVRFERLDLGQDLPSIIGIRTSSA